VRQNKSKPLVAALNTWLEQQLARVLLRQKSPSQQNRMSIVSIVASGFRVERRVRNSPFTCHLSNL
jgi:hypothetical protein